MQVYVLLGETNYEGEQLLGVYSTEENAEINRERYINKHGENAFDIYIIECRNIDFPARSEWEKSKVA